jgi:hypothetical protein
LRRRRFFIILENPLGLIRLLFLNGWDLFWGNYLSFCGNPWDVLTAVNWCFNIEAVCFNYRFFIFGVCGQLTIWLFSLLNGSCE